MAPVIPALRKQRQKTHKFKPSLQSKNRNQGLLNGLEVKEPVAPTQELELSSQHDTTSRSQPCTYWCCGGSRTAEPCWMPAKVKTSELQVQGETLSQRNKVESEHTRTAAHTCHFAFLVKPPEAGRKKCHLWIWMRMSTQETTSLYKTHTWKLKRRETCNQVTSWGEQLAKVRMCSTVPDMFQRPPVQEQCLE